LDSKIAAPEAIGDEACCREFVAGQLDNADADLEVLLVYRPVCEEDAESGVAEAEHI
jgi:hypothetical protein